MKLIITVTDEIAGREFAVTCELDADAVAATTETQRGATLARAFSRIRRELAAKLVRNEAILYGRHASK